MAAADLINRVQPNGRRQVLRLRAPAALAGGRALPWLRQRRGISQDKLPDYIGFFQFVHNPRRRDKALLGALLAALVT